jgi:hypothetical protein
MVFRTIKRLGRDALSSGPPCAPTERWSKIVDRLKLHPRTSTAASGVLHDRNGESSRAELGRGRLIAGTSEQLEA